MRATTAIEIVESAYRLDGTETEWLDAIVKHMRADIDTGSGVYGFTGNDTAPNFAASPVFVHHDVDPEILARLGELNATVPAELFTMLRTRLVTCGALNQFFGADSAIVQHFRQRMEPIGIRDGFSLFAQDAQGGNITLAALSADVLAPSPRVRGIWQRVGIHVVNGLRLRRKLAARSTKRVALLSPAGKIEDASADVADDSAATSALRTAVRSMDRARRASVRSSPDEALTLWRGLVAGQWSLVDHWEEGGRRYVAAYANRPGVKDPRALTTTESAVLRYIAHGSTNKDASYALGLPEKTVSWCVTRIMKKLGVRSRVQLTAMLDTRRLDLAIAGESIGVLMTDVRSDGVAERLTKAEREIAESVARGWSNARIATTRSVSAATVAKQLQSIYDKLGVDNRSQLARALSRSG